MTSVQAKPLVLVTGATSGIGEGLARAWHARGAHVIAAGRNADALARLATACSGIETLILDVTDVANVSAAVATVTARHDALDMLINNAGVQHLIDFTAAVPPSEALLAEEIDVNLRGLVRVTTAFLPLLRRRPSATLVHVGSGLAYVPLIKAPLYSASKAAVHAFTIALREQLRGTGVRVVELVPPAVTTNLHRGQTRKPLRAMPLDAFIADAMRALDSGAEELPIGLAKVLRLGSRFAPGRFLRIVNKG